MTDRDIRRAAEDLVAKHGAAARSQAALSSETLLAAGHFYIQEWSRWRRIAAAVDDLLPEEGEALTGPAGAAPGLPPGRGRGPEPGET
jgi:hypothetical protein